jgi:glycosyltransferase (activator-dependent family)
MRVLFTAYPEKTHFLLMAPLAWALRTAGHEVRFAVQPKFVDEITQAGLTAVPVGSDRDLWSVLARIPNWLVEGGVGWPTPYDAAERAPEDVTWEYLHSGYEFQVTRWHKTTNVPMTGDLVAFARHWQPDLVIWEPTTYAGSIAANACGAAHARVLIGADVYGITREHYLRLKHQRPAADRSDPMAEWLSGYARKYGGEFTEELITGHFTLDVLPPSVRVNAARLRYVPLRYTPYGGPAVVPYWLWEQPSRPRVALSFGLTLVDHAEGYAVNVQDILDALADLDIEVVATIAETERRKLDRIPDNARLVAYVPLHALIPTCSAVIHHAGVGTLATTALYGVPQLALPLDVDQPVLADRLAVQGAGLAVYATEATGQTVRENLLRLLHEPAFGERAARLRDEMLAQPSPNQLVPHLEELAAAGRAGRATSRGD